MSYPSLSDLVSSLTEKTRHYLATYLGCNPQHAHAWQIFQALSLALRERIMVNWVATLRSVEEKRVRRLYYLSMEYLPGRLLANTVSNLDGDRLLRRVVEELGYSYGEILSMEPDPGLGHGGLGRLVSCFLESLATQKYPAMAYGLRYQYGTFEQQLWEGVQVERPDCWLLKENPWGLRRDGSAQLVKFGGVPYQHINAQGEVILDLTDYEKVRALPFDFPIVGFSLTPDFAVVTLRLWSTKESPHNFLLQRYNAGHLGQASENTALTDVLYPNDNHEAGKRARLKQEFLLVSASLRDIMDQHLQLYPSLENFAEKVRIQINDTHPALVIPELLRMLLKHHSLSWKRAWEMTQEVVGYTNHTVLIEALEEWNEERLAALLPRQYEMIKRINQQLCNEVRSRYPQEEGRVERVSILHQGQIRMAPLAIYGSHKVNGVAKLHGDILKNTLFKDLAECFPEKFLSITNGITPRHWLWHCNPLLSSFLTERIGKGWLTDFTQIAGIAAYADKEETQNAFLTVKRENKKRLIHFLKEQNTTRDAAGSLIVPMYDLDPHALFDMQIKRVHEYKRQLMHVLHLIMLYHDLLDNVESRSISRVAIFAGKAAPGYEVARYIIQLIVCLARTLNRDTRLKGKLKVVFVENYEVSRADMLIPATDLSEQISTAGMEASGTGNMKCAVNGALTIGTEDGANLEMHAAARDWWPFAFGASAEELQLLAMQDRYNPWDVYRQHPPLARALDALKEGVFAEREEERAMMRVLFDVLMNGYGGARPDRYFVLYDLPAYYATQKLVETYFIEPKKWACTAIHNIASMGYFSADRAIREYAEQVWGIAPCPLNPEQLLATQRLLLEGTPHYNRQ